MLLRAAINLCDCDLLMFHGILSNSFKLHLRLRMLGSQLQVWIGLLGETNVNIVAGICVCWEGLQNEDLH